MIVVNDFFKPVVPKRITTRVLGFNDSIGVKQESVTRLDRQVTNRILGIRYDAEQ